MNYIFIWIVACLVTTGIIIRPFHVNESIWAISGSLILFLFGAISSSEVITGIGKGLDVYLFLTGMMLLAETARSEKVFEWLAGRAAVAAKGSGVRLFFLVYIVGTIVTIFLSNDATAIVLTPAVAAAVKSVKVQKPVPYLLICAFIANAASFVLPISNPANLVIYGSHMPSLLNWVKQYFLPSFISIISTCILLYCLQRKTIAHFIENEIDPPALSQGGRLALFGIGATTIVLLITSGLDIQLGLPTAITGIITSVIVLTNSKTNILKMLKGISWSILFLVAGLFVIVEALNKTGVSEKINILINGTLKHSVSIATWCSSIFIAIACNLINNLPAALIAGNAVQLGHVPEKVRSAILIAVDLGPNLSVTGSLATILWLVALRREKQNINAWYFLKLGSIIMIITLLCVIGSLWLLN